MQFAARGIDIHSMNWKSDGCLCHGRWLRFDNEADAVLRENA